MLRTFRLAGAAFLTMRSFFRNLHSIITGFLGGLNIVDMRGVQQPEILRNIQPEWAWHAIAAAGARDLNPSLE